ncbi:peptide-methionine (R)-S-oxide reductase MsrB [Pseudohalocynthiibacter aestuariivivens]|jgi:peptide-methionine (R)-S-oxide reductase|uniref:peptide-methionine (R)-S-oxide reductase n=1 Tax=Pseudohalocynthiibacter aestuariivivens TaxID=1591409 RepID=A0ABV5JCM9_9RHOB|nr:MULTISPECIES: peptide-methionine (R)-S-oxide reductase MsrB [Pseudohalocynthiibacter]MBS9716857.1 peptide-methionine (R)-S-oxide reductase MsrB [Pseudohalocynthiibacter aestuariivivens]MCK0102050.1 peptide-methionine (R)-S-oxide reductase MsrB [Pseudohalocynthiibacter sp. F2068]
MKRRHFLSATAAFALIGTTCSPAFANTGNFEVTRTPAEWRARLSALQYRVMRREGTEAPFSSPYDKNYADGTYICRGCQLPLYSSSAKYDSGTGWPSFYQSLPGAIATKADNTLFTTRTEAHCRRCGSHLGHIFDDGPEPTGMRHCLNGVSLIFVAA